MTVEKIRPRTAEQMAATIRRLVCECKDAYCARRNEVDLLLRKATEAEAARDEFEKSFVHFHAAYEQAEARVNQLTDTLALRSDALNRTGESNDQLRATLARIEKALDGMFWAGEPLGYAVPVSELRAALADQETK